MKILNYDGEVTYDSFQVELESGEVAGFHRYGRKIWTRMYGSSEEEECTLEEDLEKAYQQWLAKPTVFNVNQNERLLHGSWKVVGSLSRASTSLAQEFIRLKRLWKEETSGVSSVTRILLNHHYLKIISLGPKVIPLILAELSKKPDHWFVALAVLSDSDPAGPGLTFTEATDAWLKWGREKGYLAL